MEDKYFVVLLDVIGSTKSPNRQLITERLNQAVKTINADYKNQYFSPFEITKGDEVAAVMGTIDRITGMLRLFADILSPSEMRTVIVYDRLTAGLESRRSTIIDGPAFYTANDLMTEIKKKNMYFSIRTGAEEQDMIIESFYNLYMSFWNQLTPFQQSVIRFYQRERNQNNVAKILRKKQQQIQHTLSRCKWHIINNAENALSGLVESLASNLNAQVSE